MRLFTRRGYHAVGLREIAEAAEVSLGNVYNYFGSKQRLYARLIERLFSAFVADSEPLAEALRASRFPNDLEHLGQAIGRMVETHRDYMTLIYVDIAEFDGEHVRPHYDGLAQRFGSILEERFDELRREGVLPNDLDPAVAFTAIYMQFANYFVIERLVGANLLGLDPADGVRAIARLFMHGLCEREAETG
ncbi:MAG: TetR/AcrR family transcriptional regulator [Myxococcota bacterium]|nr:TetR/AcrR family transcriptional regulator [Myxococcota bacterium]